MFKYKLLNYCSCRSLLPILMFCVIFLYNQLGYTKQYSLPLESKATKFSISFSIVGDIMAHGPQIAAAHNKLTGKYNFHPTFIPVKTLLSKADVTIANLETTFLGNFNKYTGYPSFGAPDALAKAIKSSGIDALALANNHIFDKEERGLIRTLQTIERLRMQSIGVYDSTQS